MLNELTQIFGVSGREGSLRDFILEKIKVHADTVSVDPLGNLIAVKKGCGSNSKKIMVAAHIDEIGFMVTSINEKGFIKVRPIGGISLHVSYANRVMFQNGVIGAVMTDSNINKITENTIDSLYIDIGAKSKEDAQSLVKVGYTANFIGEYVKLAHNRVMSKSFDNRVGVYVLLECLKRLNKPYNEIYYAFTSQEEVGLRGAKVATNYIKPDIGIAVDVTTSFDTPNETNGNVILGNGAALKVMDSYVICDETLINILVDTATRNNIKYQLDVLPSGGTDLGAISISNNGVRTCGISIPIRYCHTPVSIVDLDDVCACVDLLTLFIDLKFD
jgi:putative aminopeptidase FrvX